MRDKKMMRQTGLMEWTVEEKILPDKTAECDFSGSLRTYSRFKCLEVS